MSGFEALRSRLNNALHPAVDPSDSYDPTFIGVTRKARSHPPKSEFLKEERGKQIDTASKKHGDYIIQLPEMHKPESFSGSTKSTRFGTGFNRRPMSLIASDVQRKTQEEKERNASERRLEYKREYHFAMTRTRPWNPITGDVPASLSKAAGHAMKPEPDIHTGKAMSPDRWRQNVDFSWDEKQRSKAAPPPSERVYSLRQKRIMGEGLPGGIREWSVAQQMQCGDGYVPTNTPARNSTVLPGINVPWATSNDKQ